MQFYMKLLQETTRSFTRNQVICFKNGKFIRPSVQAGFILFYFFVKFCTRSSLRTSTSVSKFFHFILFFISKEKMENLVFSFNIFRKSNDSENIKKFPLTFLHVLLRYLLSITHVRNFV